MSAVRFLCACAAGFVVLLICALLDGPPLVEQPAPVAAGRARHPSTTLPARQPRPSAVVAHASENR